MEKPDCWMMSRQSARRWDSSPAAGFRPSGKRKAQRKPSKSCGGWRRAMRTTSVMFLPISLGW
jgi:hypothetical protein